MSRARDLAEKQQFVHPDGALRREICEGNNFYVIARQGCRARRGVLITLKHVRGGRLQLRLATPQLRGTFWSLEVERKATVQRSPRNSDNMGLWPANRRGGLSTERGPTSFRRCLCRGPGVSSWLISAPGAGRNLELP